ncbi:MAG: hypothetical protein WKF92_11945 [Pyrinomonadaceae bacterium]
MADEAENNENETEAKPTITIAEKAPPASENEATPTITIAEREKAD